MQYLGLEYDQSIDLIKSTVKYAQLARKKFLKELDTVIKEDVPLILASIGPYGAHLHDGSEYTGGYADLVSTTTIQQWHRIRINACLEAGVDGLAIETIPCRVRFKSTLLYNLITIKCFLYFLDGSRSSIRFNIRRVCRC